MARLAGTRSLEQTLLLSRPSEETGKCFVTDTNVNTELARSMAGSRLLLRKVVSRQWPQPRSFPESAAPPLVRRKEAEGLEGSRVAGDGFSLPHSEG